MMVRPRWPRRKRGSAWWLRCNGGRKEDCFLDDVKVNEGEVVKWRVAMASEFCKNEDRSVLTLLLFHRIRFCFLMSRPIL